VAWRCLQCGTGIQVWRSERIRERLAKATRLGAQRGNGAISMAIAPEKLSDLLDRHWGPLLAWVGPCGGAAEDIVQQAFVALAGERCEPDNAVAWLYKTSRNLALNERRSAERRRRRQHVVAKPEVGASQRPDTSHEVLELLESLEDELREIVVAKIWGGLTFEEVAQVVQQPRATVWRHYNVALARLREIIEPTEKVSPKPECP
jgi:RNA polymerase sigma factor (sigma-70 family)